MLRYTRRLWWLILAWLLAMFGADFWKFNVMEVFASIAIIAGSIWAVIRWRQERSRKLKLIDFPDKWAAYRRKNNNVLEVQIVTEVSVPHDALSYTARAEIDGKIIKMELSRPENTRGGRWAMGGKIPLETIPQDAKTIDLDIEIQLDGGIRKSSGKRTVTIIDT
jgi:hypothetical protein